MPPQRPDDVEMQEDAEMQTDADTQVDAKTNDDRHSESEVGAKAGKGRRSKARATSRQGAKKVKWEARDLDFSEESIGTPSDEVEASTGEMSIEGEVTIRDLLAHEVAIHGDVSSGNVIPEEEEPLAEVDGDLFGSELELASEEGEPIDEMGFAALKDSGVTEDTEAGESFMDGESIEGETIGEADSDADSDGDNDGDNDADPQPTEFIEADHLVSIIESLLFSTDKPVSIATIKQIFKGSNVRTKDITRALDMLASDYAAATRGVTLEEINGGFQLRTKVDNSEYLRRLQKTRPFRLSGPALEVMSIVAYKQPVTKHEIDEIRGVESGHLLRALMERGMVNFGGKSDLPGKPMTYGTTRKFLEIFGLRNLKELPTLSEIDEILPQGIGDTEEKEKLSDLTGQLSNELAASYSEGEDELDLINEELSAIDTTSEFFEQEKVRERDRRDRDRAQDIRERLVMGDSVEEKDRRWLDRYEAKLHAVEAAATSGTPVSIPHHEGDVAPEIGDALEQLTDDSRSGEIATTVDETEMLDDLEGHLDWNEDLEAADEDLDPSTEV